MAGLESFNFKYMTNPDLGCKELSNSDLRCSQKIIRAKEESLDRTKETLCKKSYPEALTSYCLFPHC